MSDVEIQVRKRLAEAEEKVLRLQEDFMVLTHQLQGPLNAASAALSFIQRNELPKSIGDEIGYVQDMIDDTLSISFGVFSSFAHEAGRSLVSHNESLSVMYELRRLVERLRRTNQRSDLTFKYVEAENLPAVDIDNRVFTSIFYSLIQNAMKYADTHSEVAIRCFLGQRKGFLNVQISSIGEPVLPSEHETIFEKYQRGNVISKSGRHYSGVGLGLWVARSLSRAVGGDIAIELAAQEPRLSVFEVQFPISGG